MVEIQFIFGFGFWFTHQLKKFHFSIFPSVLNSLKSERDDTSTIKVEITINAFSVPAPVFRFLLYLANLVLRLP